jgi:hypothetical protein
MARARERRVGALRLEGLEAHDRQRDEVHFARVAVIINDQYAGRPVLQDGTTFPFGEPIRGYRDRRSQTVCYLTV